MGRQLGIEQAIGNATRRTARETCSNWQERRPQSTGCGRWVTDVPVLGSVRYISIAWAKPRICQDLAADAIVAQQPLTVLLQALSGAKAKPGVSLLAESVSGLAVTDAAFCLLLRWHGHAGLGGHPHVAISLLVVLRCGNPIGPRRVVYPACARRPLWRVPHELSLRSVCHQPVVLVISPSWVFTWAETAAQYDDLDGPPQHSILFDDEGTPCPSGCSARCRGQQKLIQMKNATELVQKTIRLRAL